MGGSIEVKSAKGKGSCFTLTLPLPVDQDFDSDAVLQSCRTPVAVICGNTERKRYWKELFGGSALRNVQVFTAQDLETPAETYSGSAFVVVDAYKLDIAIDEVPTLADNFFGKPLTPRILVNAPRDWQEHAKTTAACKYYRCWTGGANPDDVKQTLSIAYWTMGSEPSRMESDEELWSWMSALRCLTVLVADDNELNRHVLSDMLAYTDAAVVEARDGAEALAILSKEHIDIALLDIQMPEMTGVEVMRVQAQRKPLTPVPMIALTADTTEECRAECLSAGARSILHKPVDMKTLYRELYEIVTDGDPMSPIHQHRCLANDSKKDLLDYAVLQELSETGRRADYVPKLAACFKQEGKQLLHGLQHAFHSHKITDGRSILHRLKGMCGSIGAIEMATLCEQSLTLSDTELSASATRIIDVLYQLHKDSAVLLDVFSDSSVTSRLNCPIQGAPSSPSM
jgi:CheY-like chemotaxis protein